MIEGIVHRVYEKKPSIQKSSLRDYSQPRNQKEIVTELLRNRRLQCYSNPKISSYKETDKKKSIIKATLNLTITKVGNKCEAIRNEFPFTQKPKTMTRAWRSSSTYRSHKNLHKDKSFTPRNNGISMKVEDRLFQYKKEHDNLLVQERFKRKAEEMSKLHAYPKVSSESKRILKDSPRYRNFYSPSSIPVHHPHNDHRRVEEIR